MIPQIAGGFTRMPNYFLDDQLGKISPASFAILAYICRRTLGFNQLSAKIPLKQFLKGLYSVDGTQLDNGAGVSNKGTLIACLAELREKGLIDFQSVRGKDTIYTVILPASTNLEPVEEKASTNSATKQVPELVLGNRTLHPSGRPKTLSRKKELEKKKKERSITAPIDFSKFGPGGKYEKLVQPNK